MPKDYAKKKAPKKKVGASRKNNNNSVPLSLWLMAFVLLALLSTGLYYLKFGTDTKPSTKPMTQQKSSAKTQKKPASKTTNNNQSSNSQSNSNQANVPEYDLHDELIKKEVKIPAEDLKLPESLNKYYYTMPCGSFREKSRAEELKARIALTGHNSDIKPVKSKGETWYRVQLGPFNEKRKAERIRHILEKNDISYCIINRHIKKD